MRRLWASFAMLVWVLGCVLLSGCGETNDPIEPEEPTDIDRLHIERLLSRETLSTLETTHLSRKSIEDVLDRAETYRAELSSGERVIPSGWLDTEDRVLRAEYFRAQLIQQFGNIPEVHIFANWELKQTMGQISTDEFIEVLEAQIHLWPSDVTQETLDNVRNRRDNPPTDPQSENAKLKQVDPHLWAEREREILIDLYGDIPEVHTVVDFTLKRLLEFPTTDAENLAYLEALFHIDPDEVTKRLIERYRAALAAGIPFKDVDVADIVGH